MRNARTDTAHGSPVFWAEPFAAPRNLPTGWTWIGRCLTLLSRDPWWTATNFRPHSDYHPAPRELEPDDGDASSPAAEAGGGRVSGAGDVAAGAGDEDDHGGSVPPVAADGMWAPGLLGAAVRVGMSCDPYEVLQCRGGCVGARPCADVFDRHGTRLRVVLRRPVRRGDYVWSADLIGPENAGDR